MARAALACVLLALIATAHVAAAASSSTPRKLLQVTNQTGGGQLQRASAASSDAINKAVAANDAKGTKKATTTGSVAAKNAKPIQTTG